MQHCHVLGTGKGPDVFTDSSFQNLGLPKNPEIFQLRPDLPADFRDLGLGAVLNDPNKTENSNRSHQKCGSDLTLYAQRRAENTEGRGAFL